MFGDLSRGSGNGAVAVRTHAGAIPRPDGHRNAAAPLKQTKHSRALAEKRLK
ncbi:hypothetical protein [Aminobacter sp. MSH1]|uniref:hypothetical protein n=1 Tax=Aminobacter sp. MSH1 TaxID=374606 RepID=UPI00131F2B00|nr:hypothetical protein [Aminobacter sp. MSH1]